MSEEKDEPNYMLCLRTDEPAHVPCEVRMCAKCSHDVWVSIASLKVAEQHQALFLCSTCFFKRMENLPEGREVRIKAPNAEQVEEIRAKLEGSDRGHQ